MRTKIFNAEDAEVYRGTQRETWNTLCNSVLSVAITF